MFCKYAFKGSLFTAFIVKNINLGIIVGFFLVWKKNYIVYFLISRESLFEVSQL